MTAARLLIRKPVDVEIDADDVLRFLTDADLRGECARRGLDAPASDAARTGATTPTGADIRAARGLLDWSLHRLAEKSRVSVSTLKRIEDGSPHATRARKFDAVLRALEAGGAGFRSIDGATCLFRRAAARPAGADDQRVPA